MDRGEGMLGRGRKMDVRKKKKCSPFLHDGDVIRFFLIVAVHVAVLVVVNFDVSKSRSSSCRNSSSAPAVRNGPEAKSCDGPMARRREGPDDGSIPSLRSGPATMPRDGP